MKKGLIFALIAATATTFVVGLPLTSPAFACGGEEQAGVQAPPKNMVVFYTASRRATRCFVPWRGTPLTTTEMSLADARERFRNMKRSSERLTEFRNYGSWYEYYQDGKWYAVGYYGAGEEPFSYKEQ
jgi:hypothetical protein